MNPKAKCEILIKFENFKKLLLFNNQCQKKKYSQYLQHLMDL